MAESLDTTKGWCCDGRTYTEHAAEGGGCCQAQDTQIENLPQEGKKKALDRLEAAGLTEVPGGEHTKGDA